MKKEVHLNEVLYEYNEIFPETTYNDFIEQLRTDENCFWKRETKGGCNN